MHLLNFFLNLQSKLYAEFSAVTIPTQKIIICSKTIICFISNNKTSLDYGSASRSAESVSIAMQMLPKVSCLKHCMLLLSILTINFYWQWNSKEFSAAKIYFAIFVYRALYNYCRNICIVVFKNKSSCPKNFLQANLVSGNLVPRFHHFLHLCLAVSVSVLKLETVSRYSLYAYKH